MYILQNVIYDLLNLLSKRNIDYLFKQEHFDWLSGNILGLIEISLLFLYANCLILLYLI